MELELGCQDTDSYTNGDQETNTLDTQVCSSSVEILRPSFGCVVANNAFHCREYTATTNPPARGMEYAYVKA